MRTATKLRVTLSLAMLIGCGDDEAPTTEDAAVDDTPVDARPMNIWAVDLNASHLQVGATTEAHVRILVDPPDAPLPSYATKWSVDKPAILQLNQTEGSWVMITAAAVGTANLIADYGDERKLTPIEVVAAMP